MKIHQLPVGQMQANCYLLALPSAKALVIDPGDDADFISEQLQSARLTPIAILATHGHFDHLMAATQLQLSYDIPLYLDPRDQFLLDRMPETIHHFLGNIPTPPPPKPTHTYDFNKPLKFPGVTLKLIHTPGHTPGSVSFYHKNSHSLFAGDVLFANGGYGRTDFSYSNALDLQAAIQALFELPPQTTLYPGHGSPSTLQGEKKFHH